MLRSWTAFDFWMAMVARVAGACTDIALRGLYIHQILMVLILPSQLEQFYLRKDEAIILIFWKVNT